MYASASFYLHQIQAAILLVFFLVVPMIAWNVKWVSEESLERYRPALAAKPGAYERLVEIFKQDRKDVEKEPLYARDEDLCDYLSSLSSDIRLRLPLPDFYIEYPEQVQVRIREILYSDTEYFVKEHKIEQLLRYSPIWSDEFDGPSLDMTKWTYEVGNLTANNEVQYHDPSSVSLNGAGQLIITAKRVDRPVHGHYNYTSGRIVTRNKVAVKYGRIKARIKMPRVDGLWSGFWMMGANIASAGWPSCGQIAIMECAGGCKTIHGSLSWAGKGGLLRQHHASYTPANPDKFTVYTVEWSPDTIDFYVGKTHYYGYRLVDYDNSAPTFHEKFFISFSLAVGGNLAGNNIGVLPAEMVVDYIRIYSVFSDADDLLAISKNYHPLYNRTTSGPPIGKQIRFKSNSNHLYVSANNGLSAVTADRSMASQWETFTIEAVSKGVIALKSVGRYVSMDNSLGGPFYANRDSVGLWEQFIWIATANGYFSLLCHNEKYAGAYPQLKCSSSTIGRAEEFYYDY